MVIVLLTACLFWLMKFLGALVPLGSVESSFEPMAFMLCVRGRGEGWLIFSLGAEALCYSCLSLLIGRKAERWGVGCLSGTANF